MNEQLSNNEVGFATDLNDIDGKYYLNSHKETPLPNDNIAGQSPTLTDSQQKDFVFERERMKLNNILHTGEITNNNISTFSDYEFADSSFVEDVLDSPVIEKGCCYLI